MSNFLIHGDVGYSSWGTLLYHRLLEERQSKCEVREEWQTEVDPAALSQLNPFWTSRNAHNTSAVFMPNTRDALWVEVDRSGYVVVRSANDTLELAIKGIERIRAILSPAEDRDPDAVRVNFWWLGPNGPRNVERKLEVPSWDDIHANYPARTREHLTPLYSDFKPDSGGKLILWAGEAGTGKTYALRALAKSWRKWCKVHYVVDPDKFFKEGAAYLVDVLLNDVHDEATIHGLEEDDSKTPLPQWRLLVFEDAGELLTEDAKERTGQGLARLLNVCDGLVGQGLRVMMLITTNEDIKNLHPAVIRPGRCAARVEFGKFTVEESKDWLIEHGGQRGNLGVKTFGMTLAELFAQLEGRERPKELVAARPRMGFAPPDEEDHQYAGSGYDS